ncbi:MAG TPA: D-alanyl-D-alanine carboxypeptidase family protein [Acidimicrobiales bacterium]|nr:D-alanyl-D-alanine carboxypeptidase family protein [Acidimicrobiales bacterium]
MSDDKSISARSWADALSPGVSDATAALQRPSATGARRLEESVPKTGNKRFDTNMARSARGAQRVAKAVSSLTRVPGRSADPAGGEGGPTAAPRAKKGPLSSVLGDAASLPDGIGVGDIKAGIDAIASGDMDAVNRVAASAGGKVLGAMAAGPAGAAVGGKIGAALGERGFVPGGPVAQQASERVMKVAGKAMNAYEKFRYTKWIVGAVVLSLVLVILLGGQAGAPSPAALNPPAELANNTIPGDYFDAYVDSVRFASEPLPWALIAGVGEVATDHGRRSPYDTVDRTVEPNAIYPEVNPPITGAGNGPLLLVVDPNPPQDDTGPSAGDDPATSTTLVRTPTTSVLGGGRPKSTTTTAPRSSTTTSARTPTSLRMKPIANVTPAPAQSAVLPERGVNPNEVHVQSIDESAEYLAHLMADYSEELASQKGLDIDDLVDSALDNKDSASFWVEVLSKMPISLGSGDAASCTAPPGTPVPVVISVVWRCEGAKVLDKLQIVVGLGDPKYVPATGNTAAHSEPGPPIIVTGQAALNQLVVEALDASYVYSSWGAAPCDPKTGAGGVFPINPPNRCDVATNVSAAAQAVLNREATPVASRGSSTTAQADYGWLAMPAILGKDGFLQKGFPPSTNLNDACEAVVINASYRMPADGAWSNYDPSDRSHDAELDQQWQASAINQSGQNSVRCAPYVTNDPTWRHAVAETLLSTATTSDDGSDDSTTTTTPGGSTTTSTTMKPPAKNANLKGLAAWLGRDPLTVSPQFGTTSVVNRLSNPKVLVTAPSIPAIGQDYFARQVIRVAAAYLDKPSPFPEDASFGIAGVPPVAADAYRRAAALAPHVEPACRITVSLIAAVGQVETNHGQGAGSTIVANGVLSPPVIGPAMNGQNSQPAVADTDGGTYDKDSQWDHEIGLMRARPSVFTANRIDANNDTVFDPQNVYDAASTLAVTLCRAQAGKSLTTTAEMRAALTAYRNDKAYVDKVMAAMAQFAAAGVDGGGGGGDAGTPVQGDSNLCLVKTHGIVVNCAIGEQTGNMIDAAARDGLSLTGSGWRSYDSQVALRRAHCGNTDYDIYEKPSSECKPPTARPGHSQHEVGYAIDFNNCSSHSTACYNWLSGHARDFGFANLPSEPWHWSAGPKAGS